jgi:glutamate-ammonia-ligase adenylyltransferase
MVDRRRSRPAVDDAVERSADPVAVRLALDRIDSAHPSFEDRVEGDPNLRDAVIAVCGASRSLTMLLEVDVGALDILGDLEARPALDTSNPDALKRWKSREYLRIAARDLMGHDELEVTVEAIAALGRDVLQGAASLVDTPEPLVVVGMGKLGGNELNYASDIDVMFVGDGDGHTAAQRARALLEIARRCFRVDVNLRPQGRDGPRAHARVVRGVLGSVGRRVGVPGAHQGASRRR